MEETRRTLTERLKGATAIVRTSILDPDVKFGDKAIIMEIDEETLSTRILCKGRLRELPLQALEIVE